MSKEVEGTRSLADQTLKSIRKKLKTAAMLRLDRGGPEWDKGFKAAVEVIENDLLALSRLPADQEEIAEACAYLSRLFKHVAPQCEPLSDLMGLCTQIDNAWCYLKDRAEAAEARLSALSSRLPVEEEK